MKTSPPLPPLRSGEGEPEATLPSHWTSATRSRLRRHALAWFDAHHRKLPWRANRDPYPIWVAEVMLQQTTVAAVIPYFERFLAAFPTVQALAEADEQAVLKLWQGLGYYRRARHLHEAAKMLHEHSELPDDEDVWRELPGVGRYILGAVLSQAFERRMPIVEANTLRVYSRLCGSRLDPRQGEGQRWVWAAAEALLPSKRIGDFNQAMMELGALVCTPTTPKCGLCPLRRDCVANAKGLQEAIPPMKARKAAVDVREVAVVLWKAKRLLLCQRPANSKRWASMWEIPHAEIAKDADHGSTATALAAELGFQANIGGELLTVKHGVTRFRIILTCLEAEVESGEFMPGNYVAAEWVEPKDLGDYPASTPQRALFRELLKAGRQRRLC